MVVYTIEQRWEVSLRTTYRGCRFRRKNHLFRWSSFWPWRVCKQAKLSPLGHRKPAHIHWKANAPKTSHCLVQRHNWLIFLRKWAKRGCCSPWRSLSGHIERIFFTKIEEEDILNNWFQQDVVTCHTAEATLVVLLTVFEDRIISRRADVVWPARSCELTP